ncbi:MAG: lysophospholipase [Lachnospiraceae bacterium]|nr:lysophospholipase [Lachnospiraceae bacterium]
MKKEEFFFDSRDGVSKVHAIRYTPEDGEIKGVYQIVHGMSEHFERYEDIAEFLTSKGFVVVGENHLGHGKTVPEGGLKGYFCENDPATVVVRDVHRLKKMTQELYPGVPYFLMGHSMGSFIARNYIMRYGTGITGAIIMGTGNQSKPLIAVSKFVAGFQKLIFGDKHPALFINNLAFGGYNKRIKPARTFFDWLSVNEENVDSYIEDPDCGFLFTVNGFATLFELISRLLKKKNLQKVPKDLPILFVSGAEDPVGDYSKGVMRAKEALEKVGVKDITVKIYPGLRHEILNEDAKDMVKEDIYNWVMTKL